MKTFDVRQHLLTLNGKKKVPPKLLFEGEVLDYPDNPRVSVIVGFPDACTYILGQQAKWARDKTNAEAQLRKERAEAEEKARQLRIEESTLQGRVKEIVISRGGREETEDEKEEREETEKLLVDKKIEVKEHHTKVIEVKKEEYHAKRLRRRQATVFETGTRLHAQIRTKTRQDLLAEKKVVLVETPADWSNISEKLAQGFTIVAPEFPLYLKYKELVITGHPDIWTLTPEEFLDVEEWKGSKTGKIDPAYHTQAILYSLALKEIFQPKGINYTVKVWNKGEGPLEGIRLLTRMKTGETDVPLKPSAQCTLPLNGTPKEINTILDFTYNLFTAQIPCTPVASGLCKDWCKTRHRCPLFKEQKDFIKNFKVVA